MADRAIGLPGVAARMAMLKAASAFIGLWQYTNPAPDDRRGRPCDCGYAHFALQVDGIDAEYARLKAAGMTFVGDPGGLRRGLGHLRARPGRQRHRTL